MPEEKVITGVGLLLFTQERNPRLFVVEELEDKPHYHKRKGMRSFPVETREETDGTIAETIRRLIIEEVGIDPREVELCGIEPRGMHLIPELENVESRYGFGLFRGNPNRMFHPQATDVRFVGWKTPEELLAQKARRIEVDPIVEHFRLKHFRAFMERIYETA